MYITNDPSVASLADKIGVDRIFIDLEILGKEQRQGHLNTVISRHFLDDIYKIKDVLKSAELLVRCDPMNENSKSQIDDIIRAGADIVMLPMFKTAKEVAEFIKIVDKRAKVCLLLETPQAMCRIDDILEIKGIDEIHIGLNDLHLGMGLDFMFELLSGGLVEYISNKIKNMNIKFGFGGIARVGYGVLPAEKIITEHYRLGSKMAILSRSFCDAYKLPIQEVENLFLEGMQNIREFEKSLAHKNEAFFIENQLEIRKIVSKVVGNKY